VSDGQTQGGGASVRSGVVWSTGALVVAKGLGFVTILVLTRLLAPADFGVVAAVVVFLGIIELGSDLGMKSSVIYEQEAGVTARVHTAFTVGIGVAAVLSLAGVLAAPLIADFFRIPEHTGLFRLAALNVLLTSLGNIHDALLLRDLAFRRRTLAEAARAVVRASVAITLALLGFEAESLVWGLLAGTLTWTLVLWTLSPLRPTFRFDRDAARSMVAYGSGSSGVNALAAVSTQLDVAVVGRVLGERALGLYSVAFRIPEMLVHTVVWNLSLVMFPALSRKRVADREGLGAATLKLVRFQSLYVLPVACGVAVLAAPLVEVLFSSKWSGAAGVLTPIAIMTAASSVTFPLGDMLKAVGQQRILLLLHLVELPLLVATIVLAAPSGIVAVAWVRAASVVLFGSAYVVAARPWLNTGGLKVLVATGPGAAMALGVGLCAGAVRLLWDDLGAGVLLAGAVAGAIGGVGMLRALAPATAREVWEQIDPLVRRGPLARQA
jgi:PST family polysaccharide transporter